MPQNDTNISWVLSVMRASRRQFLTDDVKCTPEPIPAWCHVDSSCATEEDLRLQVKAIEESPDAISKDTKREWIAGVCEDIDQIRVYEVPLQKYIDEQFALMGENLRSEMINDVNRKFEELRPMLETYKENGSSGVKWTDVLKILLDVFRLLIEVFKWPL